MSATLIDLRNYIIAGDLESIQEFFQNPDNHDIINEKDSVESYTPLMFAAQEVNEATDAIVAFLCQIPKIKIDCEGGWVRPYNCDIT